MGLEQAVEKLRTLGVFPKTVAESAEVFRDCATTGTVANEMARRHYTSGECQFIFFHLEEFLYKIIK